jgi:hypothetical protein
MVTCHLDHYAGITGLGTPTDAMGRCEVTQSRHSELTAKRKKQILEKWQRGGESCS